MISRRSTRINADGGMSPKLNADRRTAVRSYLMRTSRLLCFTPAHLPYDAALRLRSWHCGGACAGAATIEASRMVKTERQYLEDICQVGRLVFQKGWIAAKDGNITIRLDAERILATPTGVCKGMMHPDDLIIVDLQGNKISGRAERTSEIAMHTTI